MKIEPYYSEDGITIYHGDCLKFNEDTSACALVTDPPYGIKLKNNDRDGHRAARPFVVYGDEDQAAGAKIISQFAGRPVIAFASPWKPWPGEWRNLIVWDKGGAVGGGGDIKTCLKRTWELIQVRGNGPMAGPRDGSVWSFPITPRDTADHICAKPVSLMAALIARFIPTETRVFDPFCGIGSTLIAAKLTGHRAIGIEREEKYCEIAANRLRQKVLFSGGCECQN